MISEPFSGIFGPVVVESTSNVTVFAVAALVGVARTGLKSKESRRLYICPVALEVYVGIEP